jgi:hypothetical protein
LFLFFGVNNPLCLSSSSALHFFWLFFLVHHLVNQDDRHLLAHAMASDFSVAWQCLSKRTIGFFVTDQTPRPYPTRSLPAQLVVNVCYFVCLWCNWMWLEVVLHRSTLFLQSYVHGGWLKYIQRYIHNACNVAWHEIYLACWYKLVWWTKRGCFMCTFFMDIYAITSVCFVAILLPCHHHKGDMGQPDMAFVLCQEHKLILSPSEGVIRLRTTWKSFFRGNRP